MSNNIKWNIAGNWPLQGEKSLLVHGGATFFLRLDLCGLAYNRNDNTPNARVIYFPRTLATRIFPFLFALFVACPDDFDTRHWAVIRRSILRRSPPSGAMNIIGNEILMSVGTRVSLVACHLCLSAINRRAFFNFVDTIDSPKSHSKNFFFESP